MRIVRSTLSTISLVACIAAVGCGDKKGASTPAAHTPEGPPKTEIAAHDAVTETAREPMLLLTQAQFVYEQGPGGRQIPKPGPAKLTIITRDGKGWKTSVLEDEESRVFHKAMCLAGKNGNRNILTIGATGAHLKLWRTGPQGWAGTSYWNPTFGGKWDRLRDVEVGNVDDDSEEELVIATHDQGVIAIANQSGDGWKATEVFRRADTFVHEIEIGDVDGDGTREFYATPSQPNKATHSQGGEILRFNRTTADVFEPETVVNMKSRHAKEILVADIDGDGRDELYGSIEAKVVNDKGQKHVKAPLEIRRFIRTKPGTWKQAVIAKLAGGIQARVLLAGDLRGSGKSQLIVTTMKDGVWLLEPGAAGMDGPWKKELIDRDSSGFEHAAGLADMDGDGKLELYVAADNQDSIRQYVWTGTTFQRSIVTKLEKRDLTWTVEFCK